MQLKLSQLVLEDMQLLGDGDTDITAVEYDSRKVRKGALFFCISGFKTDGHIYAPQAVAAGAAALMVTHRLELDVPQKDTWRYSRAEGRRAVRGTKKDWSLDCERVSSLPIAGLCREQREHPETADSRRGR